MRARLVKSTNDELLLLCANGSIVEGTSTVLSNLLVNFEMIDSISGEYGNWSDQYVDMALYPGETIAIVSDRAELTLFTFAPFLSLLNEENYKSVRYLSITEYAEKFNKSREIIKVYCRSGKIHGAFKAGKRWLIPEDAPYPVPPSRQKGSGPQKN